MKKSILIIAFIMCAGWAQAQDGNIITAEFPNFGLGMRYTSNDIRLSDKDLMALMEQSENTREHMKRAINRKRVGIPLLAAGLFSMYFTGWIRTRDRDDGRNSDHLLYRSGAVASLASVFFIRGYYHNRQQAVTLYNKKLYDANCSTTQLNFKVTPMQTGFVLSF